MDYAKLALLKAQLLERQGNSLKDGGISRTGLIFQKDILKGEEVKICSISGEHNAGLIVALSLKFTPLSEDESEGEITFCIDKKAVFTRPIQSNLVFMASVSLSGDSKVSIKSNQDFKLVSADVLAIGGIVESNNSDVKLASGKESLAAVFIDGEEIRLSVGTLDKLPKLTDYSVIGFGKSVAISPLSNEEDGSFAAIHIDKEGNVFLSILSALGDVENTVKLEIKASQAALTMLSRSQLAVGYTYDGFAYVSALSYPSLNIDYTIKLEEAISIEFVRECYPPAVILGKKNSSVIRLPQDEVSSDEAVTVFVECFYI